MAVANLSPRLFDQQVLLSNDFFSFFTQHAFIIMSSYLQSVSATASLIGAKQNWNNQVHSLAPLKLFPYLKWAFHFTTEVSIPYKLDQMKMA